MNKAFQAKHLPDLDVLRFIHEQSLTPWPISNAPNDGVRWVLMWDFEHSEKFGFIPEKVLRAKLGALVRKGVLHGCNCGCRGDYYLSEEGARIVSEAIGAPVRGWAQ